MRFVSPPTPRASGRSTTVVQRGNPSLATTTVRPPGVFLTTREPAQTRARYGRPVKLRGDDHPLQVGLSFFHPRGADLTCAPRAYRDEVPLNATSNSDIDLASSPVPAAGPFTSLPSSARPEPTHKLLTGKRESGRSTPHSCCEVETREKHRGQQRSKSCAADTTLASLREVVNKPVHAKA